MSEPSETSLTPVQTDTCIREIQIVPGKYFSIDLEKLPIDMGAVDPQSLWQFEERMRETHDACILELKNNILGKSEPHDDPTSVSPASE